MLEAHVPAFRPKYFIAKTAMGLRGKVVTTAIIQYRAWQGSSHNT